MSRWKRKGYKQKSIFGGDKSVYRPEVQPLNLLYTNLAEKVL